MRGFTLIELMITIGILAILAAVALPAYKNYLEAARRAELPISIDAIVKGEISFYQKPRIKADNSEYRPCFLMAQLNPPNNFPSKVWPANDAFNALGFHPAGTLHFQYGIGYPWIFDLNGLVIVDITVPSVINGCTDPNGGEYVGGGFRQPLQVVGGRQGRGLIWLGRTLNVRNGVPSASEFIEIPGPN